MSAQRWEAFAIYLALALAQPSPALAEGASLFDAYGVEIPPKAYAYRPAHSVEVQLTPELVVAVCGPLERGCARPGVFASVRLSYSPSMPPSEARRIRKAALTSPDLCVIVVPEVSFWGTVSYEAQDSIRKHEWAHCNGLDHGPNGRGWFVRGTHKRINP